jgi:hypothetical protein
MGEGIEALVQAGDGFQPALGSQSWEESGYLAELGDDKKPLRRQVMVSTLL